MQKIPLDALFCVCSMLAASAAYRLAGTQSWEIWPLSGQDDTQYDFNYTQSGAPTVLMELAYRLAQVRT